MIKIQKNCNRCGKAFDVSKKHQTQKYCSSECYRPKKTVQCQKCGKVFSISPCRKGVFCSRKCAGSERRKNYCATCGKDFLAKTNKAKYCSDECRTVRKPKVSKSCDRCGKEILVHAYRSQHKSYCSIECQYPLVESKPCLVCGNNIKRNLSGMDNAKFCSTECYRQFQMKDFVGSKFMRSARRRAELIRKAKGTFSEKEWQEKIKYYGNRCYLCGTSLDKVKMHKEHRIPVSRGGSNWLSNIAPSCIKCNLAKNSMTEKEFRSQLN